MKLPNDKVPSLSPFWITNNITHELSGFYIDFLKELFKEMDRNYTIDKTLHYPSYSSLCIKGDFFQKIKHNFISVNGLKNGEYDLLMGDITMMPSRAELIDFSVPFQTSEIIIYKRQSRNFDTNIFSFLLPLSYKVWVAVLISLLLG